MSLRSSADTLVANVAQQASALLLFVAVPNILPVAEYALVVVATVILGFVRFPDLGLSLVYSRDAPALHASGDVAALEAWNRTVLWFGIAAGSAAGVAAGAALYASGAQILYAILLAMIPPILAASAAYVSFASAAADFRRYRDVQVTLSAARLLVVPATLGLGLAGWFLGQLAAGIAVLGRIGLRWIPRPARIEWRLVREHLPSALQLALITVIWSQLLDSARLFATIHYEPDVIASYGIIVAGYQSGYSLVIAAFLPVSVTTLRLVGSGGSESADYVQRVIRRTLLPVFALTVAGAEIAPWLLTLLFPRYAIDPFVTRLVVYGLSAMPVVATVGTLLVGNKRHAAYFLILIAAFASAAVVEAALRPHVGMQSAAYAQVAGTFMLAAMLLTASAFLFPASDGTRIGGWFKPLLWLGLLWACYLGLRYLAVRALA